MSIIAVRDNIMAADRQESQGGLMRETRKIWKVDNANGTIAIGCVGDLAKGLMFRNWFMAGEDLTNWPKFQIPNEGDGFCRFVVLHPTKGAYYYEVEPVVFPIYAPYFATGSGAEGAYGAMHHGATAEEAVQAAIAHNQCCGFGVDVIHVPRIAR